MLLSGAKSVDRDAGSRLARSGHVRTLALAATFILAQVLIIVVAATALEGVNAMRAYATGEAQWSKAQKRAVISLMHYAGSRDTRDLEEFHVAMAVIDGDSRARTALEQMPPDIGAAERGFLDGLNAPQDVWGLSYGFLILHRWAPFGLAVEDWRRADGLTADLSYLSGQLRGAIETDAPLARVRAILAEITALDRRFSDAEYRFSVHMGQASRAAKSATVLAMEFVCLFICLVAGVLVRQIAEAGVAAERRARNAAAEMRDYAELAADWLCELDRDLRIVFISPRFAQIAGESDLKGRHWLSLGGSAAFKPLNGEHGETLARRLPFRDHQFKQETGGPVFYWSISGKPLFDADGTFEGYRAAATDITRFVEGREELSRARDEAMHANKAKSSFLANMSHELRTPLNAIIGFAQFIERGFIGKVGNPKYSEYAGDIRQSGEHLLAIINDVLELSRIEAGQLELREQAFDINDTIDAAIHLSRELADEARLRLQRNVPDDLPYVVGDPLRLKMVLINLVSNAIKFTPPGGAITLGAAVDAQGRFTVAVSDTGIGMDADGIEEALRPFGQVDNGLSRKFEGAGLGLPLAKRMVELHSGEFAIRSEPGAGTVVTVTLPAWRVGQAAARAVA